MGRKLPDVTKTPCNECPWRVDAVRGYLGPHSAEQWAEAIHGDAPIACHITLKGDDEWSSDGVKQCAGAATMRANVFKSPRDPEVATGPVDRVNVFNHTNDFKDYHNRSG